MLLHAYIVTGFKIFFKMAWLKFGNSPTIRLTAKLKSPPNIPCSYTVIYLGTHIYSIQKQPEHAMAQNIASASLLGPTLVLTGLGPSWPGFGYATAVECENMVDWMIHVFGWENFKIMDTPQNLPIFHAMQQIIHPTHSTLMRENLELTDC